MSTKWRTFMKLGTGSDVGVPGRSGAPTAQTDRPHRPRPTTAATVLDPRTLEKYKDPLPLPTVLPPVRRSRGHDYFEVAMTQFAQQLHADLPPTTLWGYGDARHASGSFPGPTLEVRAHRRVRVKWINNIQASDFLIPAAFDPFLDGSNHGEPRVKTVVHVHGAHVPTTSDGFPDSWFTRGFALKGPTWTTEVYEYPNKQDAATLWYHDHAAGQTRLNVYAGLAGLYLIRSDKEEALQFPCGAHEVPLVIQDRILDADGSLLYPVRDQSRVPTNPDHPGPWVPEVFGDVILVNGKAWPFFDVEPRKYRFRLLNGSNARYYNLQLSSRQPFIQIGADQGLLPRPVQVPELLLAPGERADVIVDFADQRGDIYLTNNARAPYPGGDDVDPDTTAQIMKFRIATRLSASAPGLAPAILDSEPSPAKRPRLTRNMAIIEFSDRNGDPIIGLLNNRFLRDTVTDKPQLGTVEIWNIINTTGDSHPIHLHLVKFQVLRRQAFDVDAYMVAWNPGRPGAGPAPVPPDPFLLGAPRAPDPGETGFKDTVRADPGEVTTIVMRFEDYPGKYPWHCHILEHEDNTMMLFFEAVKGGRR